MSSKPIIIATRGSALALVQANQIADLCRTAFPELQFELKIIKTTGDKLQTASMTKHGGTLPKGLFTKELEVALLEQRADLAVHSLKDLPTDLPDGLKLAATPPRADVRDVLVYRAAGKGALRGLKPHATLKDFPKGATVATCSTRRKAQLLVLRPDLKVVEIRGNVPTRLQKVADQVELDATVLAFAGLSRLKFSITSSGRLAGEGVPDGLLAVLLDIKDMLPCPGQGAIGIEIRQQDERIEKICAGLNHHDTFQCVTAERAFLHALGGGCLSPVAAYAEVVGAKIRLSAVSFRDGPAKRGEAAQSITEAVALGEQLAARLK